MADPVTPNINIFQAQSAAFRQQLPVDLEAAKETERVKDFAQANKEKIKQETEKISEEMGHDAKIIRHEEPVNRFPEDEKKEGYERKMKRIDGNHLEFLEKDLLECRKMYASIEYNDREKLDEARKGLKSKNNEESISTKDARDHYEKTLTRFKDAKVKELEEKIVNGVNGKKLSEEEIKNEVRELVKKFGCKEAADLYAARSEAKAETLMGRDVVKKCWGLLEKTANVYNKLPLWSKIGLSAATLGLGVSVATGAAAAAGMAGVASLAIGTRRLLGGMVASVGTAKLLDAGHQVLVKRGASKDADKLIEELDKIEGENRVAEGLDMISALLDTKIANVDAQLKAQKKAALANKFIGITAGVFVGGLASKAFGLYDENFGHAKHAANVAKGALAGTMEHPVNAPTETVQIRVPGKDIHGHTVHDSFIKNLKDHIKDAHKDIDHPGEAAETIFHDAAKNYALEHKISYAEAVKKLSNIHPGTTYTITEDSYGMHMHIDDEHVKFVKSAGHGHYLAGAHEHDIKPVVGNSALSAETPTQDFQEADLGDAQYDFKNNLGQVKEHLATIDHTISVENPNDTSIDHDWDKLNDLAADRVGTVNEMNKLIGEHATFSSLSRDALKEFTVDKSIVDKVKFWREIKDLPYRDAIERPGVKKGVLSVLQKYSNENLLGAKALPLNNHSEKFGHWIARIINASIEKRAGLQ